MSQETVKSFFDFVRTSEDIQNQFKNGISYEGIISVAAERGYNFSEQELQKHLKEDKTLKTVSKSEELSEEELEAVAGGVIIVVFIF